MSKKLFVLILALFFFFTASGNIDSIDATSHMYLAKQMVTKGRLDYGNDQLAAKMVANRSAKDGNYYMVYNFGYAFFFVPGVLLSEGVRSIVHSAPSLFPAQPDYILTWYANLLNGVIVTAIAIMVYKIIKRLNPKDHEDKWWLLLLSVFATNMVIQGHNQFAHPVFTLFALLAFWKLWDYAEKGRGSDLILFSILFAVTASLYNTTFVLLIVPFLCFYLRQSLHKEKPAHRKGVIASGSEAISMGLPRSLLLPRNDIFKLFLSLAPAILVQLAWNYIRFGNPFLTGYLELGFKVYELNPVENLKHLIGMTIGPNKGLFFNNPLLILSYFIAVQEAFSRKSNYRGFSVFYLAMSFFYFLNYSLATIWHGESTYGPRYLFILVPLGLPFFFLYFDRAKKLAKAFAVFLIAAGVLVQVPGLLIPHFTFPHISKPFCIEPDYRYYDPRCSPPLVGWIQILKRESKETPLIFKNGPILTEKYPNPLAPFRTLYPDPLFDRFSQYKTTEYPVKEDLFNCVYAFSLDVWWLKQQYYANITAPSLSSRIWSAASDRQ